MRNRWLELLGLALLFVALRWNNFNSPLIRDEGEYAYAAQLLTDGVLPYDHAFIQKPPMVIYCYTLAGLMLPEAFWSPRLLAYVAVALATLLLGYVARLEFGKGFALPTMVLATPMILLPGIEQFPANTEMFMLLPLLATIALYAHARQHGQKTIFWLAAGFSGATTLCFKYTALPLIAFVFGCWLVESWRQTRDVRGLGRQVLAVALGGVLAAVLELGIFLVHDGGFRLWECTVRFNHEYLQSCNFKLSYFQSRVAACWHSWPVLFLVPWAVFLRPAPRLWFWLGAFVCSVVATGASSYGQYYIPLMPIWALLAAVGIGQFAAWLGRWPALSGRRTGSLLLLLVLGLVLAPDWTWMTATPERFVQRKMAGFPFVGSQIVARRVAELSRPDDYVYVAGSEPQLLYYARRISPTRFITVYALTIPTSLAVGFQREAIRDLQTHPPRLITLVETPNSWMSQDNSPQEFWRFMMQLLGRDYQLVGVYAPGGQGEHWSENPTERDVDAASLLLFKLRDAPPEPRAATKS